MAISLAQLISQVRSQTDRLSDPSITDDEITNFINDAGRALVDEFNKSAPHWLQKHVDFTLTGDTFELSTADLPTDFELDLGLDWLNAPGAVGPVTIKRLPTFQDRNQFTNVNPLIPGNNYWNRNYEAQGDQLRVYAPNNLTAGDYRLWYVQRWLEIAAPITTTFAVSTAFDPQDDGLGFLRYAFGSTVPTDHPVFVDAMVGGTITTAFDMANDAFEVTGATITGPANFAANNIAVTDVPWPGGSPSLPVVGTTTITYQPEDTTPDLPNVWQQFKLFLLTHASISVRMKFEEQIGELQQRLAQEANRCVRMAEKRDSDLAAIPILNGRNGVDSPFFDNGDGWGYGDW